MISDTYLAITAPEIEMLMIHSLGMYQEYNKYHKKPSIFLAEQLKVKTSEIKSYPYICKFYENHDLVNAIKAHKQKSQAMNRGCFLADILK
jgi:DNA-binding LytR/AlgR family response regulator